MVRVFGFRRSFFWGWISASSLLLILVISGCVISPRRTFGGGPTPTPTPNPTGTPTPTPSTTPQGKLYVSNAGSSSILRFDGALTDSGNIPPAATISGSNTGLTAPAYITLDTTNDRLFVANNADLSILIFDNISTKSGNVAPERKISGSNTTLVGPIDLTLDRGRNLLYVADDLQILVFSSASSATGNLSPARTLTPGFSPQAIFIDGANDRLYVADSAANAISVYDSASTLASGSITASRTIQGAATHLSAPNGVLLDGSGRLVVSNASTASPSITIYNNAAVANGNLAPAAEIVGSNTGFSVPSQIAMDSTGTGTLYMADPGAARIAIYSSFSTATGNIAPNRTIVGPGTTLTTGTQPVGVAIDTTR